MGQITGGRNWSTLVNNRRISNYFTAVLPHAVRIAKLCVSHALVASAPGVPLQGMFDLHLVARLMKEFALQELAHKAHKASVRGGCARREVWEKHRVALLPRDLRSTGPLSSPCGSAQSPLGCCLAQRHSTGLVCATTAWLSSQSVGRFAYTGCKV